MQNSQNYTNSWGKQPTGPLSGGDTVVRRIAYYIEILHCFVCFVINYKLTLRFIMKEREPG